MSYQTHFFSLSFPLCCLFSTAGTAAGALIPQFSQILLIKCVDSLILHNGITSLCHDIVLKYALSSFSIGNWEVTTKCCMNHVEGNFTAFTILLFIVYCSLFLPLSQLNLLQTQWALGKAIRKINYICAVCGKCTWCLNSLLSWVSVAVFSAKLNWNINHLFQNDGGLFAHVYKSTDDI